MPKSKLLTKAANNPPSDESSDNNNCSTVLESTFKSTQSLLRDGLIIFGLLCGASELIWDNNSIGFMEGFMGQSIKITRDFNTTTIKPVQSPRYMVGNWVGDTWIPPQGWKYYTPLEIQETFRNKSIMFVGDSTSRRGAGTLYTLLDSNPSNGRNGTVADAVQNQDMDLWIDLNKITTTRPCHLHDWNPDTTKHFPQICRPMPSATTPPQEEPKDFVVIRKVCFTEVEEFLADEAAGVSTMMETARTDLLVLAFGIWEAVRAADCRDHGRRRTIEQLWEDTLVAIENIQNARPDMTIIWRTSGFDARGHVNQQVIHDTNNFFMDSIDAMASADSKLTYINFGGAIEPRSFGNVRLKGDVAPHYGPIPRMVLSQMITNAYRSVNSMGS